MSKIFIALDNGVGTVAIIRSDGTSDMELTPIKKCLSYTKKENYVSRFDVEEFKNIANKWLIHCLDRSVVRVGIERPFTSQNPMHTKAVHIGMRIHEAQIIAIEQLGLAHEFLSSGDWQKTLLPIGITGSDQLKKASLDIGKRKWPHLAIKMKKDADALFIAEYMRQKDLNPAQFNKKNKKQL